MTTIEAKIIYSNEAEGFVIAQFERDETDKEVLAELEPYATETTANFVKCGLRFNPDWKGTSSWDRWPEVGYTIEIGNILGVHASATTDVVCSVVEVLDLMPGLVSRSETYDQMPGLIPVSAGQS